MRTDTLFRQQTSETQLRRLRDYLRARVRDHAVADDILQEALVQFWRKLDTLRDEGAAGAFLRQIVRRKLVDVHRRKALELPADTLEAAAPEDDFGELELTAALADYLPTAIGALPDAYRDVLRAVDLKGVTQKAFAKTQGLPYSTVKSRYRRARQLLRAEVDACCEVRTDGYGRVTEIKPRCRRPART